LKRSSRREVAVAGRNDELRHIAVAIVAIAAFIAWGFYNLFTA
jgi:hypothetical protein